MMSLNSSVEDELLRYFHGVLENYNTQMLHYLMLLKVCCKTPRQNERMVDQP